jgi:hypothetical protein
MNSIYMMLLKMSANKPFEWTGQHCFSSHPQYFWPATQGQRSMEGPPYPASETGVALTCVRRPFHAIRLSCKGVRSGSGGINKGSKRIGLVTIPWPDAASQELAHGSCASEDCLR